MNTYDDGWADPSSQSRGASRVATTYPETDFGFSEADDFLQQTLSTLQDLEIPVGPSGYHHHQQYQQYQPQQYQPVRGHKKQPSGTAIFGFANHNSVLSIPSMPKRVMSDKQVVAPSQVFQPPPPPSQKQEPILFTSPQQFEMHHQDYQGYKPVMYEPQLYPPAPPPQMAQIAPPNAAPQREGDLIMMSRTPQRYKFPPENPRHSIPERARHDQRPPTTAPPRTVQVPVEYLQKLTSMIKKEGLGMEGFLDYDFEKMVPIPRTTRDSEPPSARRQQHESPASRFESSSGSTTRVSSREPTPEYTSMPPPPPLSVVTCNSPPKAQFVHQSEDRYDDEPESEFTDCPKTPSPTLPTQACFTPSPSKKEISWTPVITGDKTLSMLKKKQHDKVSTLPAGEIDHYITGPREDKSFVCNFSGCGKEFTRRYNVRSHVQTHLSDRPFICEHPDCRKAFVRQHDLTRHRKIHEEFAFRCECGKKFSRHDALFRHRARNICSGGLEPSEVARIELRGAQTSVHKKRKPRPDIRVVNDSVAKRLEFDFKQRSRSQDNSPVASPRARSVGLGIQTTAERDDNVFLDLDFQFDDF